MVNCEDEPAHGLKYKTKGKRKKRYRDSVNIGDFKTSSLFLETMTALELRRLKLLKNVRSVQPNDDFQSLAESFRSIR